jgi:hypothetical protein
VADLVTGVDNARQLRRLRPELSVSRTSERFFGVAGAQNMAPYTPCCSSSLRSASVFGSGPGSSAMICSLPSLTL